MSVGSPIRLRANAELASVFCSAVICPNGPDIVLPGPTALTVIRQLTALRELRYFIALTEKVDSGCAVARVKWTNGVIARAHYPAKCPKTPQPA